MKVIITKDQFSRKITKDNNQFNLSFKDIARMVKKPQITTTKNDAPYMFPFEMNYDNGRSYTKQENAVSYTMLVFDSDSGYTISEFKERFKDYSYVLYTSFSHKAEHHKFRAMLPIEEPVDLKTLRSRWFKDWFMDEYPFQDRAVLKFCGFYLPNTPDIESYEYHINRGETYSFKPHADKLSKYRETFKIKQRFRLKVREKLASIYSGDGVASVANNEKVRAYLDSPVAPTGYDYISFVAIAVCITAGDTDTLREVTNKMVQDGFSDREIDHKIRSASRR